MYKEKLNVFCWLDSKVMHSNGPVKLNEWSLVLCCKAGSERPVRNVSMIWDTAG